MTFDRIRNKLVAEGYREKPEREETSAAHGRTYKIHRLEKEPFFRKQARQGATKTQARVQKVAHYMERGVRIGAAIFGAPLLISEKWREETLEMGAQGYIEKECHEPVKSKNIDPLKKTRAIDVSIDEEEVDDILEQLKGNESQKQAGYTYVITDKEGEEGNRVPYMYMIPTKELRKANPDSLQIEAYRLSATQDKSAHRKTANTLCKQRKATEDLGYNIKNRDSIRKHLKSQGKLPSAYGKYFMIEDGIPGKMCVIVADKMMRHIQVYEIFDAESGKPEFGSDDLEKAAMDVCYWHDDIEKGSKTAAQSLAEKFKLPPGKANKVLTTFVIDSYNKMIRGYADYNPDEININSYKTGIKLKTEKDWEESDKIHRTEKKQDQQRMRPREQKLSDVNKKKKNPMFARGGENREDTSLRTNRKTDQGGPKIEEYHSDEEKID